MPSLWKPNHRNWFQTIGSRIAFLARGRLAETAAGAGLAALMVLGLLNIARGFIQAGLNSDALYLACLYKDLFVDGYGWEGWNLPPAPYFFPDMALMFACLGLAEDVGLGYALYIAVFWLGIAVFFTGLLCWTSTPKRASLYALTAMLYFIALLQLPDNLQLTTFFFMPSFHAGNFYAGLLLLALVYRILTRGETWGILILYFCVVTAGCVSDILILPQFIIPLLLTGIFFCALGATAWRGFLSFFGLSLLAAGLSHGVWSGLIQHLLGAVLVDPGTRINPARWGATASHMGNDLYTCFTTVDRSFLIHLVLFAGLFIGMIRRSILVLRGRDSRTFGNVHPDHALLFLVVFTFFSLAGSVSSTIYASFWISPSERRYLLPCYLLPLLSLTMALFTYRDRISIWIKSSLLICVTVYSAAVVLPEALSLRWSELKLSYPSNVQSLDRLAREKGLRFGYGDYWNAKFITMYSRAGLRVNQLHPNLALYAWINNLSWYGNDPGRKGRFPGYQFIVTDRMQTNRILEEFGEPAFRQPCRGSEIFIYNRQEDYRFRNYLRSRLSRDLHAPVEPASLALSKPDGAAWDTAAVGIIPATGELSVRFDPPALGNLLEIAADNNDEYEVRIYGPDREADDAPLLGSVVVPKVTARGLRSRILPLPESAQTQSVARVVIRPIAGDGFYGVGHVFIYEDTWRKW